MAKDNVHAGHRQRLRDRAVSEGLMAFNPHQVLELLLFNAVPRQDTSEMAHNLIDRFGSVLGVLHAPAEELKSIPGIGKRAAEWLNSLGELVDAYTDLRPTDHPKIRNYGDVERFCVKNRIKMEIGSTYCLVMSPHGSIQLFQRMTDSLSWGQSHTVKKFLHDVMAVRGRNMIIIESLEEEEPTPEDYTVKCADVFGQVLNSMGAELLDVILVGRTQVISLYHRGLYDKEKYGLARSLLSENYLCEDDELEHWESDKLLSVEE